MPLSVAGDQSLSCPEEGKITKECEPPEVYAEYITLKPDLNITAHITNVLPEIMLNYPTLKVEVV